MAANHKLTTVIQGRTITGTQNQEGKLTIHFGDGSLMTVKTAGASNSARTGAKVKAVRQADTTLDLDMDDGSTLAVTTAEATSSVMVRDKNGAMEYAD